MSWTFAVRMLSTETGEVILTLIDTRTAVLPTLPVRYVVQRRRHEVAVNTMKNDLRGIGELYEWVEGSTSGIQKSPEDFLGKGEIMSPFHLGSLVDYLRQKT